MREGYKESPLGAIPEEWEIITVKEATLEHKQGYYTKEEYCNEGIKLVRITDLDNPKVNFNTMPSLKITEKDYQDFKIEKGDFLFARSGAIGRYGIVEKEPEPAIFASYLIRFRFNQYYLSNRYFGYFFESSFCKGQLASIAQGNANININAENIKSLKVPLPPLPEQQKIAEILSTVDGKIEVIIEQIEQTQELKKGLMQQLLTKGIGHTQFKDSPLGQIPETWDVKEINEVTTYVDYRGKTPPKVEDGTFLVTAKNIRNGRINYDISKEYVPTELYDEIMSRGKPTLGDVLITTEAPLGEVAAIDNPNVALAQRVIKYRGEHSVLNNLYLKYCFLSPYFQESLIKESTGSTVKGIKGSRLHKLNILIPPITEQVQLAEILSTVDDKIDVLNEKHLQYTELKKGLMQQLLTGKLRVNHLIEQPELA